MCLIRFNSFFALLFIVFSFFFTHVCAGQVNAIGNSVIYSTEQLHSSNDTTVLFSVKEILIDGNKKTKEKIILRELSFKVGDKYPLNELVSKFAEAKKRLMNTTLFRNVVVSLNSLNAYDVSINITVVERWYIFPMPFVKVVDNSLQNWVKQEGMDLRRVNYGIKTTHKNLTGNNDRLVMNVTNGYTKKLFFRYEGVQLDRELKWTTGFSTSLGKNRDIKYATVNNLALTYKNPDRYVHSFFNVSGDLTYRPAIKTRHTVGLGYTHEKILDTVSNISNVFPDNKHKIDFAELFYRFQYQDVDFLPYPTKGYIVETQLDKKGFGGDLNLWQVTSRLSASWPISQKNFFNWRATGVLKLPFDQPYKLQNFVGTGGMYLQGYEEYVIDGVAGGFTKLTLAHEFLNRSYKIPSQKIKRLNNIPLKIYGKVYGNTGYIYDKDDDSSNRLTNRWLFSGGVGVDIILFYDFAIKIEWSLNHLGQNGIYLHDRAYL